MEQRSFTKTTGGSDPLHENRPGSENVQGVLVLVSRPAGHPEMFAEGFLMGASRGVLVLWEKSDVSIFLLLYVQMNLVVLVSAETSDRLLTRAGSF